MSAKKKLSNGSLPTQTETSRRFVRRNSFHTLNCRSGSLKKFTAGIEDLMASTHQLDAHPNPSTTLNPQRPTLEIETEDLFKQFKRPYQIPLKRSAGSMKVENSCRSKKCNEEKAEALGKQLESAKREIELLSTQCKKLKIHLHEQRDKRRSLEEQVHCNQLQIKRLEKRLDKYRNQKERYEQERNAIISHIQQLQSTKFSEQTQVLQGYRVRVMQDQVSRLRMQLQKARGVRQRQLLVEVQTLIELKYAVEAELKSANIANAVLTKQLEQGEQQMEQMRESMHKAVTSSYEYVELRQRYRKMLIQYRQLRIEMSLMQQDRSSQRDLEGTFLTISESEDFEN